MYLVWVSTLDYSLTFESCTWLTCNLYIAGNYIDVVGGLKLWLVYSGELWVSPPRLLSSSSRRLVSCRPHREQRDMLAGLQQAHTIFRSG